MEYVKRIKVEAEQFGGVSDTKAFQKYGITKKDLDPDYYINTHMGLVRLKSGDWIITYSDGDRYVVDEDEFKKNYRRADKDVAKWRVNEPKWARIDKALIPLNSITSVQDRGSEGGIVVYLTDGRRLDFDGESLDDFEKFVS